MRPDPWLTVLGGFILAGLLLPLKADGKPDPPQPNQPDQERGGTRPPDQGHPRQKDSHSRSEGGHPSTQSGGDGCSDEVRVPRNTKYDVSQGEELRIGCPVVFCSQTPPTVVWYKVEEAQIQINTSSSRGIKIVWEQTKKLEGTSFLVFESIHSNNSGLYQCAMKGTIGHIIKVQVYGQNETITTKTTNHTTKALNKNADTFWIYLYFVPGIVLFVVMVIIISIVSMRGCRAVKPKETQPENQYASVPMVELSGHHQLSQRGSPVVPPGRRSTKKRPAESTPSGKKQQLHPPMSQDRNRLGTEDNASGVLYVTLNLQQRSGGRPARTEEPPSEYAAIRVK